MAEAKALEDHIGWKTIHVDSGALLNIP